MPSLNRTLTAQSPRVSQSGLDVLRIGHQLRIGAAQVIRGAMPHSRKRMIPLVSACGVSRARHGDDTNPLYRTACWLVELRDSGAPRERAQRIVDWLQEQVDNLWPPDPADINTASEAEQEVDGQEDAAQLAYHLGRPGARELWVEHLRTSRARERTLLIALEAEARGEAESAQAQQRAA